TTGPSASRRGPLSLYNRELRLAHGEYAVRQRLAPHAAFAPQGALRARADDGVHPRAGPGRTAYGQQDGARAGVQGHRRAHVRVDVDAAQQDVTPGEPKVSLRIDVERQVLGRHERDGGVTMRRPREVAVAYDAQVPPHLHAPDQLLAGHGRRPLGRTPN